MTREIDNGLFQQKVHTPTTKGMLENLTGGGANGSGNSGRRGVLNLQIPPRGLLSWILNFSLL